ncbi:MAG: hypothetical protein R2727_10150 [Bacteroidales bacterium]
MHGRVGSIAWLCAGSTAGAKEYVEVTGGQDLYDAIEEASEKKAHEMGMEFSSEGTILNTSTMSTRLIRSHTIEQEIPRGT